MTEEFREEFKSNAIYRIDESLRMISIALAKIAPEDIWQPPNASITPIGNLLLHICGNMTQYVITGLSDQQDNRNRTAEFSKENKQSKDELLQKLLLVAQDAKKEIDKASDESLLKKRGVQGFTFSGIGMILHAVEHLSYHTGQIALQVKLSVDQDLGFYEGLDLDANTHIEGEEDLNPQ